MANVNAPVARFEKLIINPIRRLLSPNAKAVVPPRNPLFSTVVLSPKYARHEGKPNPSEKSLLKFERNIGVKGTL